MKKQIREAEEQQKPPLTMEDVKLAYNSLKEGLKSLASANQQSIDAVIQLYKASHILERSDKFGELTDRINKFEKISYNKKLPKIQRINEIFDSKIYSLEFDEKINPSVHIRNNTDYVYYFKSKNQVAGSCAWCTEFARYLFNFQI